MKKLIVLLIIFITTGCVDYKELNSLAYITGIGIDYTNNQFIVTYEVMDNKKEGDVIVPSTFTVNGYGDTNFEAHIDAASKLQNTSYYAHTQVIVISDEALEKLNDITDYVIRNPKLNEEFYFLVTKDNTPEEIFNNTSEEYPAASYYLSSLINDNIYSSNYYINLPFAQFVDTIVLDNIDPAVSVIKIVDSKFILEGMVLFKDTEVVHYTDTDNSNLYNAFNNSNTSIILTTDYEDSSLETITQFEKIDIKVTANKIIINADVIVEIKKNPIDADLEENDTYNDLANTLSDVLDEKLRNFIITLQNNKSDILGLSKIYYIDTRKENNNLWQTADIEINTNLSISRKGLIYNAKN